MASGNFGTGNVAARICHLFNSHFSPADPLPGRRRRTDRTFLPRLCPPQPVMVTDLRRPWAEAGRPHPSVRAPLSGPAGRSRRGVAAAGLRRNRQSATSGVGGRSRQPAPSGVSVSSAASASIPQACQIRTSNTGAPHALQTSHWSTNISPKFQSVGSPAGRGKFDRSKPRARRGCARRRADALARRLARRQIAWRWRRRREARAPASMSAPPASVASEMFRHSDHRMRSSLCRRRATFAGAGPGIHAPKPLRPRRPAASMRRVGRWRVRPVAQGVRAFR